MRPFVVWHDTWGRWPPMPPAPPRRSTLHGPNMIPGWRPEEWRPKNAKLITGWRPEDAHMKPWWCPNDGIVIPQLAHVILKSCQNQAWTVSKHSLIHVMFSHKSWPNKSQSISKTHESYSWPTRKLQCPGKHNPTQEINESKSKTARKTHLDSLAQAMLHYSIIRILIPLYPRTLVPRCKCTQISQ